MMCFSSLLFPELGFFFFNLFVWSVGCFENPEAFPPLNEEAEDNFLQGKGY